MSEIAENEEVQEKSYSPYGAITFGMLDDYKLAMTMKDAYMDNLINFIEMSERIIYDEYDKSTHSESKTTLLKNLANEFVSRLESVEQIGKSGTNEVIGGEHLVERLDFGKGYEDKIDTLIKSEDSFMLFKAADGKHRWIGIPTNKFEDRDNPPDILAEKGHLKFIEKVYSGNVPFPELWIWHIPKAVGNSNWLAYDERGFLVAGGEVDDEFLPLVKSLLEAEEAMGMSHGMPKESIVYEDGIIVEYESKEFSLLPKNNAANLLTNFGIT